MAFANRFERPFYGYLTATVGVVLATAVFIPLRGHANTATVSLCFLVVVLAVASVFGSRPALIASILSAFAINFFFLPPYYTLTISEPENWISLFVFLAVAITVGQLSATSRERASEAERLYRQLQDAFEKASEAEGLRQSEKLKSALLDAVTHDLRTPLTSIKAAVTMLMDENSRDDIHSTLEPEGRGDLLAVINEETDRLNDFVESMVELARLEAGATGWQMVPVSIEEIVSNALQRSMQLTEFSRFDVRLQDDLPRVNADPKAIAEALYNLLDNAVKYSPQGTTIMIRATSKDSNVRLSVEDDGPGIPLGERQKIFQKFHRADHSARGFGMGLAIVRGIIEAHGGTVWVEQGIIGSRFVLELPVTSE